MTRVYSFLRFPNNRFRFSCCLYSGEQLAAVFIFFFDLYPNYSFENHFLDVASLNREIQLFLSRATGCISQKFPMKYVSNLNVNDSSLPF